MEGFADLAIKNCFISCRHNCCVIVALLYHRPFENIKADGNAFKMFSEKNAIYWLIYIDCKLQEIVPSRL